MSQFKPRAKAAATYFVFAVEATGIFNQPVPASEKPTLLTSPQSLDSTTFWQRC